MERVKILHCADNHIGAAVSFLGTSAGNRQNDIRHTFEKIVDTAATNGVQLLLIAGDLFDSVKVESGFVESVIAKIAEIPDIKVVYAAGNHDPLTADSPFITRKAGLPKNLYIMNTVDSVFVFEDLHTVVYGRSFSDVYMPGAERFSLSPDKEYINIMLLHGDLNNDLSGDYNPISKDFLRSSQMDYVALGHIHKCSEIGEVGSTRFAYCGCPEGQGFDELDEKGVLIGEIGKGFCQLEFVPTAKRRHILEKIDITGIGLANEITQKITTALGEKYGDNFHVNLYKIVLTGAIPEEYTLPLTEIKNRLLEKMFFVKLIDGTEYETDLKALSNEISLKGIFVKNMLSRLHSASENDRPILQKALMLGLKAFGGEVSFDAD